MDPRLLRLYNDELTYLREVGAEFAREFPKIAARLTLDGIEVSDPYVERLLEGFAFLTARIQLKLDAEHPRLVQHLLETVYPGFLAPVPSMMIACMRPDPSDPKLVKGATVPRQSTLTSDAVGGQGTRCEFRTAQSVTLWPLEIASAQYFTHAADLPVTRMPGGARVRGGLRIRLRMMGEHKWPALSMDRLRFYINAPDDIAFRLHELLCASVLGTWVQGCDGEASAGRWADGRSVSMCGFEDGEALLPDNLRGFSGYRLLQEYAALPQRFMFFEVGGLAGRLSQVRGAEAEIVVLLGRGDAGLEPLVDEQSLALYCTPAVNLFPKRLDRVQVGSDQWEHHLVPDRTRPMDFEVYRVDEVRGHGTGEVGEQTFLPLYATYHTESGEHEAYFTVRREPRVLSAKQKLNGPRSSYVGQETFISLVDPRHAPFHRDIRQLSVSGLVSNRDLPTFLPTGGATSDAGWQVEAPGVLTAVGCLRGPTRPLMRQPSGDVGWSMISQLTANYLSLVDAEPAAAAAAMRSMLSLYGSSQDPAWAKQVEALQAVDARRVVRRLPFPGPLTFGTGVEIRLTVDDMGFQGASPMLLASVLERLLTRHVAMNTFCETVLLTTSRGEIMRWAPRIGSGALA